MGNEFNRAVPRQGTTGLVLDTVREPADKPRVTLAKRELTPEDAPDGGRRRAGKRPEAGGPRRQSTRAPALSSSGELSSPLREPLRRRRELLPGELLPGGEAFSRRSARSDVESSLKERELKSFGKTPAYIALIPAHFGGNFRALSRHMPRRHWFNNLSMSEPMTMQLHCVIEKGFSNGEKGDLSPYAVRVKYRKGTRGK
ncbi:hypothetical protein DPX16_0297 [Anabarilius grahami]|uniref:Uncharacterized protein n=1 Tax=Anabarilius grahami TaxID=495550 RepID=A0A3N0XXQ9_ANAGA|nr:hypothetical protein DPX16_0297 [Anabarilius grahami]